MITETPPVVFKSVMLDHYIEVGMAVDQIVRTQLQDPSVSVRLRQGVIEVWQGDEMVRTFGCAMTEPTSEDWLYAAARLAGR